MRIALVNKDSQGVKSGMIYNSLKKVTDQYGLEVDNYGVYVVEDEAQLTHIQVGTLAVTLLNVKAAGYVITGCGTGEGAILAYNSFPDVICGHMEDVLDAYMFIQINDGNAIAIPFAEGFGWGGDLSLEYIFEKSLREPPSQGHPKERTAPEQRSKRILDDVRKASFREDLVEIFKGLDQELVKGVFSGERFGELSFGKYKDKKLTAHIRGLIG